MADDPMFALTKDQHAAVGRMLRTSKGGPGDNAAAGNQNQEIGTKPLDEPRPEWLKVNSNNSGYGKYDASTKAMTAHTGATGGASLPEDAGTRRTGCILINAEETGLSTHWLKADESKYVLGRRIGYSEDDGKPLFLCDGGYYRNASPPVLGPDATNSTKKWHRDEATAGDVFGDDPIKFYFVARGAGASLYQRYAIIDAGGKGFQISEEQSPITLTTTSLTVTTDGPTVWTTMTNIIFPPGTTATQAGGDLTFDPFPGGVSTGGNGGAAMTVFRWRYTFSVGDDGIEVDVDASRNWLGTHMALVSIAARKFDTSGGSAETNGDMGEESAGGFGVTFSRYKVGSAYATTGTVNIGNSNTHGGCVGQLQLRTSAGPTAKLVMTPVTTLLSATERYRVDVIIEWFSGD